MNERPADRLAIAVAQLNPIVGDVSGNLERARKARAAGGARARRHRRLFRAVHRRLSARGPGAQAGIPGRLPAAVEALARETADGGPAVLIGAPWVEDGKLYNAYALLAGGRIEAIRFKVNLPNYGVFDEKRVFASGPVPGPVNFRGVRLGLPICEDTWTDWGDYENVVECLAETGAEMLVVPNGSPYWRDKIDVRLNVASRASPRRACRSFMSIRSAARTNWCSTALRSRSTPIVRSPSSCRRSAKRRDDAMVADRRRLALRAGADGAGRGVGQRRITPPACWACAITSTRTASRASCSGCRAASIRRCARRWRSMRSAASACAASCCRTASPRRNRATTPPRSPKRSACATTSFRSKAPCAAWKRRSPASLPARRATSPRRICRRVPAAPS